MIHIYTLGKKKHSTREEYPIHVQCIHVVFVFLSPKKGTFITSFTCSLFSPLDSFPKKRNDLLAPPPPPPPPPIRKEKNPYLIMLGHHTSPSTHRLRQQLTVTPPLIRPPPQLHIRHLQHILHRRVHNLATDNRNHRRRILGEGFPNCMGVGGRLGLVVRGLGVGGCVFFEELHAS